MKNESDKNVEETSKFSLWTLINVHDHSWTFKIGRFTWLRYYLYQFETLVKVFIGRYKSYLQTNTYVVDSFPKSNPVLFIT